MPKTAERSFLVSMGETRTEARYFCESKIILLYRHFPSAREVQIAKDFDIDLDREVWLFRIPSLDPEWVIYEESNLIDDLKLFIVENILA